MRRSGAGWTRRRALGLGLGSTAAVVAAGVTGVELISRGVLPGKVMLDELDGACSVPGPAAVFSPAGPSFSGTFYSAARRRTVGYTIAYPPRYRAGDELPLVIMLHGYGGNHTDALVGMSPAQAMALRVGGRPLAAMAMVTVDGGGGYWNPHPGDDPMAMVIGELILRCQRLGLGRPPRRIATMGISMGGYGALLMAERYPRSIAAVAAISPAIWTSYAQAAAANEGAYASAAAFAADDAVRHAPALARHPVRVASGYDDPFYPGVQALARALPGGAVVKFGPGCHTSAFFAEQQPPSLAFLARYLLAPNGRLDREPCCDARNLEGDHDDRRQPGCVGHGCHRPHLSRPGCHEPRSRPGGIRWTYRTDDAFRAKRHRSPPAAAQQTTSPPSDTPEKHVILKRSREGGLYRSLKWRISGTAEPEHAGAARFADRSVSVQPRASTAVAKGRAEPGDVNVISAHLHR